MIQVRHERRRHHRRTGSEHVGQQTGQIELARTGGPPQDGTHEVAQTRVGQHPLAIEAAVGVAHGFEAGGIRAKLAQRPQARVGLVQVSGRGVEIPVACLPERDGSLFGREQKQPPPAFAKHLRRRSDRPRAFELRPGHLPREELGQPWPALVGGAGPRHEGIRGGAAPCQIIQRMQPSQCPELGLTIARDPGVLDGGGDFRPGGGVPNPQRDRDWRPNREHIVGLARCQMVTFEIDDPQVIQQLPQLAAQSRECRAAQV